MTYQYLDSSRTITTTTGLTDTATNDPHCGQVGSQQTKFDEMIYDGLGRTIQAINQEPVNGTVTNVVVQTNYDGLGRVAQTSNPYPQNGTLSYWTKTTYDVLSRPVQVAEPDGSNRYIGYSGNQTTTVDEGLKWRQTVADAAGRLTMVVEDPPTSITTPGGNTLTNVPVAPATALLNLTTKYSYDALDDLVSVNQNGQLRTFAYDGLKHLVCAANPESSVAGTSPPPCSDRWCSGRPAEGRDGRTWKCFGPGSLGR